jgi:hypothetical protein
MDARAWLARIEANGFPMSAGGDLAAHLAAKGLLMPDLAARAVGEYARFLALRAAGVVALPSPLVEEVWQEHLKDSSAYFDRLCTPVFGRPIHHAPGPYVFADNPEYRATLAAYRAAFGAEAPEDIWPTQGRMRLVRAWEWVAAGGGFICACAWIFGRGDLWWLGGPVLLVGLIGLGMRAPVTMNRGSDAGG